MLPPNGWPLPMFARGPNRSIAPKPRRRRTADALAVLMVGAGAFAAQTVVVRGWYAVQNTLTPAVFGTAAVALSIPLYVVGIQHFGLVGVGFAISLSAIIQVILLYHLWNRRSGNTGAGHVYRLYGKVTVIGAVTGGIALLAKRLMFSGIDGTSAWESVWVVLVISGVFSTLLLAAGRVARVPEIGDAAARIMARIRRP